MLCILAQHMLCILCNQKLVLVRKQHGWNQDITQPVLLVLLKSPSQQTHLKKEKSKASTDFCEGIALHLHWKKSWIKKNLKKKTNSNQITLIHLCSSPAGGKMQKGRNHQVQKTICQADYQCISGKSGELSSANYSLLFSCTSTRNKGV